MKITNFLLILTFITTAASCEDEPEQTPSNTWKLIEQLMDPGDGSGVFTAVISDKTIEFLPDSTITSTGSFCVMSTESDNGSMGTYSETTHIITPDSCANNGFPIPLRYEMEGANLILNYPCFEPCREKYELVE